MQKVDHNIGFKGKKQIVIITSTPDPNQTHFWNIFKFRKRMLGGSPTTASVTRYFCGKKSPKILPNPNFVIPI
jgi:hypothetical protein